MSTFLLLLYSALISTSRGYCFVSGFSFVKLRLVSKGNRALFGIFFSIRNNRRTFLFD